MDSFTALISVIFVLSLGIGGYAVFLYLKQLELKKKIQQVTKGEKE